MSVFFLWAQITVERKQPAVRGCIKPQKNTDLRKTGGSIYESLKVVCMTEI